MGGRSVIGGTFLLAVLTAAACSSGSIQSVGTASDQSTSSATSVSATTTPLAVQTPATDLVSFNLAQYSGAAPRGWTVSTLTADEAKQLVQAGAKAFSSAVPSVVAAAALDSFHDRVLLVLLPGSRDAILVQSCQQAVNTAQIAAGAQVLGVSASPGGEVTYEQRSYSVVKLSVSPLIDAYETVVGNSTCHSLIELTSTTKSPAVLDEFRAFVAALAVATP